MADVHVFSLRMGEDFWFPSPASSMSNAATAPPKANAKSSRSQKRSEVVKPSEKPHKASNDTKGDE